MLQAPVSELRKGTLRRILLWGQAFTAHTWNPTQPHLLF